VSPAPCACSQLVFAGVASHQPPQLGLRPLWPQMGRVCQPAERVHVASKLKSGEPSAEDILAVIGELGGGSETRMKAYSAMFQQKATSDYQERFHASKLLCEHEALSLRGPGQMFQALEVPPKLPRIDLAALQQIIHLAASTLDLEVVRQQKMWAKRRRGP